MKPPVEEGEEYEVKIEAKGSKGDGITKIEGYTVFVPNSNIGQELRIKITRVLSSFAFAEIINKEDD